MATINKKHNFKSDLAYNLAGYFVFGIIGLICVYPFYYLMICTISDNNLVELGNIVLYPKGIHFDNYLKVLSVQNLGNSVIISLMRTLTGTIIGVLATSYMAYFFTKQEMVARTFFYRFVVATMYFSAGMIPIYLNNTKLGLTNTFFIYIIPGMISVYNMVLIKTSIEAMPRDLEESAFLDGAGYMRRFFIIVLPLQKPILATVALFSAVGHWNDFFTTKLYVTNPKLYTMQFLLYELLNQITAASQQIVNDNPMMANAITPTGIRLTLTAIVVIPVMLIYPFVQKYFVKGIMIGAVKG